MKLTVVGSSPACPNPGGASSAYLVETDETRVLVDCGHGVAGAIQRFIRFSDISAIVLSHMHPDHFLDLIPMKYGLGFEGVSKIPLWLPPGGEETLRTVQDALGLGGQFFWDAYDVRSYDPTGQLEVRDITIDFALTLHFIPAWAMRFREPPKAQSLVYSSDTAWSEDVIALARGAELLLIEAAVPRYEPGKGYEEGHLTPERAGQLARQAGVQRLVLTHYWHRYADTTRKEAESAFGGPTHLARQGDTFSV